MPEKTVSIINLSKTGRRYDVRGGKVGQDKEGNALYEVLRVLPNQQSVDVPEESAKFLLSKLPNGKPRFPDLIDASQFRPELAKEKNEALAENARLLNENKELRAQLEKSNEGKKGGKK